MYSNVAEDLSVTDAASSIISTMKAYDIAADDAQEIVDKFNYVGNNFAISSTGLGDSLQRSASALIASCACFLVPTKRIVPPSATISATAL